MIWGKYFTSMLMVVLAGLVGPEIESWYGEILHADSKAYKVFTVSFPGVQQPKGYELYFHLPSVLA
jgi:hypothetical protein